MATTIKELIDAGVLSPEEAASLKPTELRLVADPSELRGIEHLREALRRPDDEGVKS